MTVEAAEQPTLFEHAVESSGKRELIEFSDLLLSTHDQLILPDVCLQIMSFRTEIDDFDMPVDSPHSNSALHAISIKRTVAPNQTDSLLWEYNLVNQPSGLVATRSRETWQFMVAGFKTTGSSYTKRDHQGRETIRVYDQSEIVEVGYQLLLRRILEPMAVMSEINRVDRRIASAIVALRGFQQEPTMSSSRPIDDRLSTIYKKTAARLRAEIEKKGLPRASMSKLL